VYVPKILGSAEVRFIDAKAGVDSSREVAVLAEPADGGPDWDSGQPADFDPAVMEPQPEEGAVFAPLPSDAGKESSYPRWSKDFAGWLYSGQTLDLLKSPLLGKTSAVDESEADFRGRLSLEGREKRDAKVDELRKRYAAKTQTLEDRLRRAQLAVEREAGQAQQAKLQTAVSLGSTVLGALFGRKKLGMGTLGRATTAARGAGRAAQQHQDVARAQENVEAISQQLADLEAELQAEIDALEAATDPLSENLQTVSLRPKKADISVRRVALVWVPVLRSDSGAATPAW
jgi:Skp family chaperone for outer membrane proteins